MDRDPVDARVHIRVRGRVQGVGFRAHVGYMARQIGVTGWVRNVGWDVVEALADGDRAQVDRFVEMMKVGPPGSRVDESQVEFETARGEFRDFSIASSVGH